MLMLPGFEDLPTLRVAVDARPLRHALDEVTGTYGDIGHLEGRPGSISFGKKASSVQS